MPKILSVKKLEGAVEAEGVVNSLLQGDTLEALRKLPDECVDLGITSPPYNKGEKQKGWLVKNVTYDAYSDKKTEEEYQQNQIDVLNEIFRVTKAGGSFFYNHKNRWEKGTMHHPFQWLIKTDWTIKQEIVWDRMIAANIRGWRFWQVDEKIYWLYKPKGADKIGEELESRHAMLSSIWRFPPERGSEHPAPFPIILPARIIFSVLNGKKGVVLDPYSGSGTTCAAAKLLNCDYIGIDISEKYCKMASNRLLDCEKERYKLSEEVQRHITVKSFSDRKKNGENTGRFKKSSQKSLKALN
ncbi:MAG TPA: site-specific DNA-methyltransferase [archaeon]|nr:site-specific DNA-methyltransferase [archaeon]